jgi:hypothetical protein
MKLCYSWFDKDGHLIQIDEVEVRNPPANAVRGTYTVDGILVDELDRDPDSLFKLSYP